MHKIFYNQNITPAVPETHYFYAGTSPDAKILRSSDNGLTWDDVTKSIYPNCDPICLFISPEGHLCYTTKDNPYPPSFESTAVVDYNTELYSVIYYGNLYGVAWNEGVIVGDGNGTWTGTIGSAFAFNNSYGSRVKSFINTGTNLLVLTGYEGTYGIWDYETQTKYQAGDFVCGIYDSANGYVYCGTSTGYIYRNTTSGNFTTWTNLGSTPGGIPVSTMLLNQGRIIISGGYYYTYTDSYFLPMPSSLYMHGGEDIVSSAAIGNIVLFGCGYNGHIWRSNNNATPGSWTDLGQQFSQTSINAIIYV